MEKIDLNQVNYRMGFELAKAEAELGKDWSIRPCSPIKLTPGRNYTAKGDAQLLYHGYDVASIVNVLFQSGDSKGITGWTPVERDGVAELYFSVGSDVDGGWYPGMTSLSCLEDLSGGELKRVGAYKQLNIPGKMFLDTLNGNSDFDFPRFGFVFNEAKKLGHTNAVGFLPSLEAELKSRKINYQIGSFVFFANDCLYLDMLRKRFG